MLEALWKSLIIASGGWLSIGSILLVLLFLSYNEGLKKGWAYVLGYMSAYLVVGTGYLLLQQQLSGFHGGERWNAGSYLYLSMGVLLFYMGIRKWNHPPAPEDPPPRWMSSIHEMTPWRVFRFAFFVGVVNFKNLAIYLSALAAMPTQDLGLLQSVVGMVLIILLFCTSFALPPLLYFFFSRHIAQPLQSLRLWLERYNHPLGLAFIFLFAVLFLIRGTTGFLS